MNLNYKNFAVSTLSAELAASADQISITDYGLFPDGDFTAVIWNSSKATPIDDT